MVQGAPNGAGSIEFKMVQGAPNGAGSRGFKRDESQFKNGSKGSRSSSNI
jgi:hypothetical protein